MRSLLCLKVQHGLMEVLPVSLSYPLLVRQKLTVVLVLKSKPEWCLTMMQSKTMLFSEV